MKNKIIDLFCGCGGLSRGFEMAGFETKIAIDMWEDAVKTYNHNRKYCKENNRARLWV